MKREMDNQLTAVLMDDAFHADRAGRSVVYGIDTAVPDKVVTVNDMEVPLITSNQVANLKVDDGHDCFFTDSYSLTCCNNICRPMFLPRVGVISQQVRDILVT